MTKKQIFGQGWLFWLIDSRSGLHPPFGDDSGCFIDNSGDDRENTRK